MNIKNFVKENKTFLIVMTLYTIITFLRTFFHQPWFDEAHAWTIADELNLAEIFRYMQYEGHTFLWYLILMPFAKTNFHYPYPMLFLNWAFCWTAVFIFWRKAPFNNIIKTLLTFSFPFFALYAIIARCYAIGIMFLFMLAALYKKQIERPYLFASLISLAANTSVMALSGVCGFGFIFTYKMIKAYLANEVNRKKLFISFAILGIGAILVLMQLHGARNDELAGNIYERHGLDLTFFAESFRFHPIVNYIIIALSAVIFPVALWKNKDAFFFLSINYVILLAIFQFMYKGWEWHHFFLLIYLIISLWIAFYDYKGKISLKKSAVIMLGIILAGYVAENRYHKMYFQSGSKYVSDFILEDDVLKQSRLILDEDFTLRFVPYLKPHNIEIYNYCTADNRLYNVYIKNGPCKDNKTYALTIENMKKVLSDEKDNYLVQSLNTAAEKLNISNGFIIENDEEKLIFEPYRRFKDKLVIYKIIYRKIR